jgi:chemotaxis protein MotB
MDVPEEEPAEGAPEWLVTFSDLVSLLVTLFIMMLTFTTQETDTLNKVMDMVKGGFGIVGKEQKNKPDLMETPPLDHRADSGVSRPDEKSNPDLENQIRKLDGFVISDKDLDEGIRIVPTTISCFAPGDDRPSASFEKEVRMLGRRLRLHRGRRFVIEGHCDSLSDKESKLGGFDALALARARRIARIMGLEGVQLEMVTIRSEGARHQRTRGIGDEEQSQNRRVEILVLPKDPGKEEGR